MKIKFLSLLTAVGMLLLSCNNQKKETTTVSTDTVQVPITTIAKEAAKEGRSVAVKTEEVPDTIQLLFTKKYPKALKTSWMKYEPVETDDMKMDEQYYFVRFNNNGADYTSWYNNHGDWVKTSTRVEGNSALPDAVNKTINDQYPGYTVEEIDKENDKDMEMYEIKLRKGDEKAKLKILPNGEIFKRK